MSITFDEKYSEPEIRLFRSTQNGPVPFDEEMLDMRLPFGRPTGVESSPADVSYRDYLAAVRAFLIDNPDRLKMAVQQRLPPCHADIDRIDITAEKHGSDYHPAGVTVHCGDSNVRFVVNAALTSRGTGRLEHEFGCLQRLREKYGGEHIPGVHFMGEQVPDKLHADRPVMRMFLADWLDGFHEFHLTDGEEGRLKAVLWDLDQGCSALSGEEMRQIHRQAAFILTSYYDVKTFEEVFPWHHAAGDFVVARTSEGIRVKLIAVRQYSPRALFDESYSSPGEFALLLFLANLTVRMRLDRIDGTGDVAWADDSCVEATVRGFLDAMMRKTESGECDPVFRGEFVKRLKTISPAEAAEVFAAVAGAYDEDAPDVPVILEHLADHIFEFYRVVQEIAEI